MREESEKKQGFPVIEVVLISLVIGIIVIAILTLLSPGVSYPQQNILINL